MSDFLKNLKESIDSGIFNSEAANKINEISKKTDEIVANTIESVKNDIDVSGEKNIDGGKLLEEKLGKSVEKHLEDNKVEPVDSKTALERNIEAERVMLKWEHESKMLKYQARILTDLNVIVKGLIELVEVTDDMLKQTTSDDVDVVECGENIVKTSTDFLSNIYEKDLQVKDFLTSFAEKFRKS